LLSTSYLFSYSKSSQYLIMPRTVFMHGGKIEYVWLPYFICWWLMAARAGCSEPTTEAASPACTVTIVVLFLPLVIFKYRSISFIMTSPGCFVNVHARR